MAAAQFETISNYYKYSLFILLLIGTVHPENSRAQDDKSRLVLVEPMGLYTYSADGSITNLKPYSERRTPWGGTFGLSYVLYEPNRYDPDFISLSYKDVYPAPDLDLLEVEFSVKRNFRFGSIASQIGVGLFKAKSNLYSDGSSSELSLIPIRVGVRLALDTLWGQAYLVPYADGGGYIVMYDEALPPLKNTGNTQVAPYWAVGALFSLDWIDRTSAISAYEDSGIEGTFLFAEARQLISSGAASDPNFGSDVHLAAGLKIEF